MLIILESTINLLLSAGGERNSRKLNPTRRSKTNRKRRTTTN